MHRTLVRLLLPLLALGGALLVAPTATAATPTTVELAPVTPSPVYATYLGTAVAVTAAVTPGVAGTVSFYRQSSG
ncbi:hypothetical protein [Motilibacter aurantiacus]|uniref:hypothetical protein n=1 Tax=Motilibacter aurantiacus TaxID=2714955 RepID=UPI00140B0232|nr:hypothetical protein [Motilibacter aurantiacus]NHC47368.1 hypothetical protein [Motilibacter aurantiacus]